MPLSKIGLAALAGLATSLTAPACAEPAKAAHVSSTAPPRAAAARPDLAAAAKSVPDFADMAGFVDKLFPPQPAPDPARLALAQTSVQAMWPDGSYGRMMTGFIGGMFDRVLQLKNSDLPVLAKGPGKAAAGAKADLSVHDKAAMKDPYFDQRIAAIRQVVIEEMGKISAIVDPPMRNGLARAMARRFDAQQLADINRFFATPTGKQFAGQYMQLWLDPDTMRSMFSSVPQLTKLMPEVSQKVKAASDKFPKPPGSSKKP